MSDRPHGLDWWQAPDGTWYPPEAQPGRPAAGRPAPNPDADRPLSPGLVAATQATLIGAVGLSAVAAAALAIEAGRFDAAAVRAAVDITAALGVAGTALGVALMSLIGSFVLMVTWAHRAYHAAARRGATGTTWSAGWAIGGWFLPLANLVIPRLVVGEIDRMSHPGAGPEPVEHRWKTQPTLMLGHWWWAATVVSMALLGFGVGVVAEQLDSIALDENLYRAGLQVAAAGLGLAAGAAAAGAVLVGRISLRLIRPPATDSG
ncbi:MAG: DUF4328 domain-containing protein [Actinomycetota bacterium]